MGQRFYIHPENPQTRLLNQAVEVVKKGGIVIYPTDSAYAFGFHMGDKDAMERVFRIREFEKYHHFTLVCSDLSEIATYAVVDNPSFRLLKAHTPGPYTFILKGTKELPKRVLNSDGKTVGLRIPGCKVTQALLELLGEPLLSCSVRLVDESGALSDPDEIFETFKGQIDLMLDAGCCGEQLTTVIDLCQDEPVILRQGKGVFEL